MKKTKLHWWVGLLAVGLAPACSDYEPYENAAERIAYDREFQNEFGAIDPDQTWDLYGQLEATGGLITRAASASEVTVTELGEEYYLKVTKEDNEKYQKMLPESEDTYRKYSETNLGRVTQDFLSTARTIQLAPIHWNTSGVDVVGIYWYTDNQSESDITVPGSDGGTYYLVRREIYTNKTRLLGIKEKSGYEYVTVGTDAQWEELKAAHPEKYIISDGTQHNSYGGLTESGAKLIKTEGTVDVNEEGQVNTYDVYFIWANNDNAWMPLIVNDLAALHSDYYVADGSETYKDVYNNTISNGSICRPITIKEDVGHADYQDVSKDFDGETPHVDYLLSQPIEVTIPTSITRYGFYITNGSSGTKYSESKLNAMLKTFTDTDEEQPACYVATYTNSVLEGEGADDTRYLCFEDWFGDATNFDLNDIVFTVTGISESSIIDHEASTEQALLVCEDLAQFDFDFNDIAMMLTYRRDKDKKYNFDASGNVTSVEVGEETSKVIVTAMAAGGANQSTIWVNGEEWGEIHTLLGGSAPTIINAGPKYGRDGESTTVYQDKLPAIESGYPTYLSQLFANGFIVIKSKDGDAVKLITNNSYTEKGTAPQMMLLPVAFEWPQEMVYIKKAYTGFEDWVADVTKTGWIYNSQVPAQVTDRGDFSEQTDGNQGEELSSKTLTVTKPINFNYDDKHGNTTNYTNGVLIDFTGVTAASTSTATLTVTYSKRPSATIYLDDKDGNQLMEGGNQASATEVTYVLTATQLQQAIKSGGIYIIAQGDEEVGVSKAELRIFEGSTNATHVLNVTPSALNFTSTATQSIRATSATGATITYASNNTSVATVNANGVVTPVADGSATITVTAQASGEYAANTRTVSVTVAIVPDGFEASDKATISDNGTDFSIANQGAYASAQKAKFGLTIVGETAGTTLTVKWAGNDSGQQINIEEGKTYYEFESDNIQYIQYNERGSVSGLNTGTLKSVYVKPITEQGGGGEQGDDQDYGTKIAELAQGATITIEVKNGSASGTYTLTYGDETLTDVESVTFTCVAGNIQAYYNGDNWSGNVHNGSFNGTSSLNVTLTKDQLAEVLSSNGGQLTFGNNSGDAYALYWK